MSGVSIYDAGGGAPPHPAEAMELAARHLDRMLSLDASTATLGDRLQGGGLLGGGGVSGLQVVLLGNILCLNYAFLYGMVKCRVNFRTEIILLVLDQSQLQFDSGQKLRGCPSQPSW